MPSCPAAAVALTVTMMVMRLAWLGCLIGISCGGGGGTPPPIIDGSPDIVDSKACGLGDDCNLVADTGCDDDQRCDVAMVNATCFQATCETPGPIQAGGACSLSNNEGALTWDNCGVGLICYQGTCLAPCDTMCPAMFNCVVDTDVGSLTLSVCVPAT